MQGIPISKDSVSPSASGLVRFAEDSGLSMWPWVVQTKQLGFCDCEMAGWELTCWRSEWIAAGAPNLAW